MKKLGTLLVLFAAGMFILGTTGCGDDKTPKKTDKTNKTDKTDKTEKTDKT